MSTLRDHAGRIVRFSATIMPLSVAESDGKWDYRVTVERRTLPHPAACDQSSSVLVSGGHVACHRAINRLRRELGG